MKTAAVIGWSLAGLLGIVALVSALAASGNKRQCEQLLADLVAARDRYRTNESLLSNVVGANRELEGKLHDSEFNADFWQKETDGLMKDRAHFQKLYWDLLEKTKKQ